MSIAWLEGLPVAVVSHGITHSLHDCTDCDALTCNSAFVLIDKVPQLLFGLHIEGALVIPNSLHPREPQAVPGGKVSADDGAHVCLHLRNRKDTPPLA